MVNGLPDLLLLLERNCARASDGKLVWWIDLARRIQASEQPVDWRVQMVARIQGLLVESRQLTDEGFAVALATGEIPSLIPQPTRSLFTVGTTVRRKSNDMLGKVIAVGSLGVVAVEWVDGSEEGLLPSEIYAIGSLWPA